jgi:serine/threonine protein kinase
MTMRARSMVPIVRKTPPKRATLIGTVIGNYRIVELLGVGGMGEVYAGEHTRIVRRVAVKFLLPQLTGNRDVVDRFFAEARSTSSIRHPGIVEIFDCDVDPSGRAYIVMELLAGESLASRLERDPDFGRDVDRPLAVAEQMASALGAAHANGIIHRDLKPDNVFLTPPPEESQQTFWVKILDFGIAKLLAHTEVERAGRLSVTMPGSLLGTPKYMSPEQCSDASNVDHRTDIYSLGCLLFEMLAGSPPFTAHSFAELVAAHLNQTPPPLDNLREGIPDRVQSLVRRLLAKSPEDRPATMEDVRAEIAAARAELARVAVERAELATAQADLATVPTEVVAAPEKPVTEEAPPSSEASEWWARGPRRSVVVLSLAAVLLAVGALALAVGRKRESDAPRAASAPVTEPAPMSRAPAVVAPPAPAVIVPAPPPESAADAGELAAPVEAAPPPRHKEPSSPRQRRLVNPALPSLSDEARKL